MKEQSIDIDLSRLTHWEKLLLGLLMAEWWVQTGEVPQDMAPFLIEIGHWTGAREGVCQAALSPQTTAAKFEDRRMTEEERTLHRTLMPLPENAHWSARWVMMKRCEAFFDELKRDCEKYSREAVMGVVKTVQRMKAEGKACQVKAHWQYVYEYSGVKKLGGKYKDLGPQVFCRWVSWGMGQPGYLDKGNFARLSGELTDEAGLQFSRVFAETYNAIQEERKQM